jgi:hypothetical protein
MPSPKKVKPFESPLELIKKSFRVYRLKFSTFATFGCIVSLITFIQLFSIRTHSMLLFIASVIATVIVSYVIYIAEIRVAAAPAPMNAWQALRQVEHYIVPSAWVSCAILILSLGGTLLLILPGIVVSVFVMFALLAVVVDHYEKTEAIIYSWHLVKERWLGVVGRLLLANIIIGAIALVVMGAFWFMGIGETPFETIARARLGDFNVSVSQSIISEAIANFFVLPLAIIFVAQLYESLKRTTSHIVQGNELKKTKHILRVLAFCGVVFIIGGFFLSSIRLAQVIPQLIRMTHAPASVFTAF